MENNEMVTVSTIKNGLLFDGKRTEKALTFYPDSKVAYTAYAPVFCFLAENGIDCFLVKMPANLAVFGMDKTEDLMGKYNSYKDFYMAGHSLVGATIASYVADNLETFTGLALLGAYTTKSLILEPKNIFQIIYYLFFYKTCHFR